MSSPVAAKRIKMRFYMHDDNNLADPSKGTVVTSAAPPNTAPFGFGSILVFDDLMTVGPSPDSKKLGRAQGTYISDSLSTMSFLVTFTCNFDNGTISFQGQDPAMLPTRDLAVIGGTGAFKFVSGYAKFTTYKVIPPSSSIIEFEVFMKQDSWVEEEEYEKYDFLDSE